MASQVAIRDNADKLLDPIYYVRRPCTRSSDGEKHIAHDLILRNNGHAVGCPHNISDPHRQPASKRTARVEDGVLLSGEPSRFHSRKRERVAQRKHRRRARGRREAKGACLSLD